MHPMCCISIESPCPADQTTRSSGFPSSSLQMPGSDTKAWNGTGSNVNVAGVLYKWTNYGKGWKSRWFLLQNGVLSYSRIGGSESGLSGDEVRVIGDVSARLIGCSSSRRKQQKAAIGVVYLKSSSFRESKSDDRRFYIFTATKTLHLRTDSRRDRVAWIEALVSARNLFSITPLNDKISLVKNDITVSTKKLRDRLLEDGVSEALIKDSEQILLSEFSGLQGQLSLLCEERSNLIDTLRQLEPTARPFHSLTPLLIGMHLGGAIKGKATNVEAETSGVHETQFQLMKHEFSSPGHGKYSECGTTESSDDIEKQDPEDVSDEDEIYYFDTNESFFDSMGSFGSTVEVKNCVMKSSTDDCFAYERMHLGTERGDIRCPHIERRTKLPDPIEKEKGVSLWSMIKDNVGKDLTRVCLPVYFNEPISSLQKCFEDLEYSYLLDRAYEYGKMGNSLMRILNVAAFAVSGYASSEGRHCKPFNPLLGETYEADYPEKGIRFFSEKVSHHPMLIACHCDGKGWKFWGDSNIKSKFWGRSIQLDPIGVLTLEFDDGEIFQWSKVTSTIYNLILGKIYCDHHGTMSIRSSQQYSCKLKFKEQSILDRNPHQVQGFVEDVMGNKVATLLGKWDDSMYYIPGNSAGKTKGFSPLSDAFLLWKRSKPPVNVTRYNLSSFAITMNELTSGLQEKLPPTDSRLRPDQRFLENGEYEKADAEKLRLEGRQRMSRKLQESGWRPRWFRKGSEDGSYRYVGGYWEAREQKKWDGCPRIFDDFSEDTNLGF